MRILLCSAGLECRASLVLGKYSTLHQKLLTDSFMANERSRCSCIRQQLCTPGNKAEQLGLSIVSMSVQLAAGWAWHLPTVITRSPSSRSGARRVGFSAQRPLVHTVYYLLIKHALGVCLPWRITIKPPPRPFPPSLGPDPVWFCWAVACEVRALWEVSAECL